MLAANADLDIGLTVLKKKRPLTPSPKRTKWEHSCGNLIFLFQRGGFGMPTIVYRNDQKISPGDVMKFAVYAEHVSRQCYDVFEEDGSRSRSEALSRRAQAVSDSLDFGDEPHFLAETTKKVLALRDMVSGMCFDTFGERGHMGKSMDLLGMARDVD
jgi:hypothetical protein